VAYQRLNILRNSSRLRVSENKRKSCFLFVEREQSQLEIKAIMQGRTDYERSSSAGLLPTGRKNMLPMTIGIKKDSFLIEFRRVRWSKLPKKVVFKLGRQN
jgi:hypothetical protein